MTSILIVFINIVCVAQGTPSSTSPPPPMPPPPVGLPIDGWVFAGILIGAFIGIRAFVKVLRKA